MGPNASISVRIFATLIALAGCGGGSSGGWYGSGTSASHESASPATAGGAVVRTAEPAVTSSPAAPAVGSSTAASVSTTTTTTVQVTTVTEQEVAPRYVEMQQHVPLLTAASVGDADRRDNYLDYVSRHPYEARRIPLDMTRRVRVRVLDDYGRPVNDARVEVTGLDHVRLAAVGRTHADGVWDFYPGVSTPGASGRAVVTVSAEQHLARAAIDVPAVGDGQELVVRLPTQAAAAPQVLDLAFLIDVTGSMEDELRYVNAEIGHIVDRVRSESPETRIRVGATFYRDRSDRHVVQQIAFTDDVPGFVRAMREVHASGGGDYPEDMNSGLEAALGRMQWSGQGAARVLVVISDAPPKEYANAQYTYQHALLDAQREGIRILPVAASGADRTVEYLFRAMGAFTSTPYVYLTDDSGIGNPHMEADTDRVAVEYFADLLTRLVVSDLRGEGMHEPGPFGPAQ